MTRIAIVNPNKCKPKKCNLECKRSCPVEKQNKECITVNKQSKVALLSEIMCNGCGICVKACPYKAITIINTPQAIESECSHRYGPNSFKLYRLPIPKQGHVLGLVGTNGIGKSTVLKILANKLIPNLGLEIEPDREQIVKNYRGSELQNYLSNLYTSDKKVLLKPQYVEQVAKIFNGTVKQALQAKSTLSPKDLQDLCVRLELTHLLDRRVEELSGGELQRFTISMCACQEANVYMFDEPSSYLDIKQRLVAANEIRRLVKNDNYIFVVEHDLAVLDYLSDQICCLYGEAGAYGVVTKPFGVREGINIFLDGYIPTENVRFRDYSLNFKMAPEEELTKNTLILKYAQMNITLDTFELTIQPGKFHTSEIIVLLGQNGTGKSTFMRALAGLEPNAKIPEMAISYKPQKIVPKFQGTVRELLEAKIPSALIHVEFVNSVIEPMGIKDFYDNQVQHLSGGEMQRTAIVLCLGKPANVYLIDEPSAYLDAEQRVNVSKIIKRFIVNSKKTAFIVEHDFMMSLYLADRYIVYSGQPGIKCSASSPQLPAAGMNEFLRGMDITFRQDPSNFRPRINKLNSVLDREQKMNGTYFYT